MKLKSFLQCLDLRWFRGLKLKPTPPIRRRHSSLQLEALEKREVFSASRPTILAVNPPNLTNTGTAQPPIQVTFSEPMNAGSATATSNYLLFSSSGASVPVN